MLEHRIHKFIMRGSMCYRRELITIKDTIKTNIKIIVTYFNLHTDHPLGKCVH